MTVCGMESCPLIHMRLRKSCGTRQQDQQLLERIVQECLDKGLAVVSAKYLEQEEHSQPPPRCVHVFGCAHTCIVYCLFGCNMFEYTVSIPSFFLSITHSHTRMHTYTASGWLCAVSTLNKNWHKQLPYSQQQPLRWSSSIRYSEHNSTVGIRFNFFDDNFTGSLHVSHTNFNY